jgi:hypothetical protein
MRQHNRADSFTLSSHPKVARLNTRAGIGTSLQPGGRGPGRDEKDPSEGQDDQRRGAGTPVGKGTEVLAALC